MPAGGSAALPAPDRPGSPIHRPGYGPQRNVRRSGGLLEATMTTPFHRVPVPEPSLLLRLTRRTPPGAALAALINRLALADRVTDVTEADIAAIVGQLGVDPRLRNETRLRALYTTFLARCLEDRQLDDTDLAELEHLRTLFRLSDASVRRAHQTAASEVYGRTVGEAIADGRLTPEERRFLDELRERLELPDDVAQRIYEDAARDRLRSALRDATNDDRLSDDEHEALQAMARNLGVAIDPAMLGRETYQRLRLYWHIENGALPERACPLRLGDEERCVARRRALWWEVHRPDRPGGNHPRDLATAIFLRPAAVPRRLSVGTPARRIDIGRLYLTTARLVFLGRDRGLHLPLRLMDAFRPYADGLEILGREGAATFFAIDRDLDLFALTLARVLKDAERQPGSTLKAEPRADSRRPGTDSARGAEREADSAPTAERAGGPTRSQTPRPFGGSSRRKTPDNATNP